ncbi:hypothetical protein B0J11DRAFT_318275 [Dendryphion nanum]|uniref:HTH araC/xylS-type domain-containing protein n=1 Tax=Dendryphion nanum TaxID=256645 RepID=A0A9P9DN05_9PLEO|nr:hypothetical protein B0J11DRAFT_318275 [Dendryphion nanum]
MSYLTDATRWRALTIRDPNANGHFVYSVKSTKCYCRPSCPARLARRANVGFFLTPAEAESAGFRACKRCKPQEEVYEDTQETAVAKACALIEEALNEDTPKSLRLQELAKNVGLTPRYFHKIFKDKTGMTPKEYAKAKMEQRRIETNGSLLTSDGQLTIGPFDLAEFDFNDLVDYSFDPHVPTEGLVAPQAPFPHILPATFGQEIDVNIQSLPWNGTCVPNAVLSGPVDEINKSYIHIGETESSASPEWILWDPVAPVISTFELDAAVVLRGDSLPQQ